MTKDYFSTRFTEDANRKKVWEKLTPFFQKYIGESSNVVEIGAGYCYFINQIKAGRKIAVDTFKELASFANSDVEPFVKDARNLSFLPDGSVDVIFASNFLEHFEWNDLDTIASEVHRVLKINGKVIIMQPNYRLCYKNYFNDFTHRTIFTDQSVLDWFQSKGFKPEIQIPRFMPFSLKSNFGSLHWLIPLYLRSPVKPLAGQMMFVFQKK
jgi:SAM-dependent methyltransferase